MSEHKRTDAGKVRGYKDKRESLLVRLIRPAKGRDYILSERRQKRRAAEQEYREATGRRLSGRQWKLLRRAAKRAFVGEARSEVAPSASDPRD